MNPAIHHSATNQLISLHRCQLIVDGNTHNNDLCLDALPDTTKNLISEALLPQIRTIAILIAASRHDFNHRSPDMFTEEADFFAARILVLGVRKFHLDITLKPMLALANQRAEKFARQHNIPFTPAKIQMSLHAKRPKNLLIIETEHPIPSYGHIITNTLAFAQNLPKLPL